MRSIDCMEFLRWALPRLGLRWPGFRKVHGQVCKRIGRRLKELGVKDLDDYRERLVHDCDEWRVLDDLCHITVSCFYRDRHVFEALGTRIFPELVQAAASANRPVACWCAGSASGEEVYTLKVMWDIDVQRDPTGTSLEVIGSDADETVLRRAERGCYSWGSLKHVPPRWLDGAFERRGDQYCVREAHREGVTFLRQDIRHHVPAGRFDLIFCRNVVFTYFETELQRTTLDRISSVLGQGGYLVIGTGEALPDGTDFVAMPGCPEILRKSGGTDQ